MANVKIAIVGDFLMKRPVIASARRKGGRFEFHSLLRKVRPYLKSPDVTIGNLETTFSGYRGPGVKASGYPTESVHPRTGYPRFNCPDELASALKAAGFNVMVTANNHSMDGGASGLKRTLGVLNRHGLKHTGTYRTAQGAGAPLIVNAKGMKIGILSYTRGTNSIPVPQPWMVNKIGTAARISSMIRKLRAKTDFIIVYLHFGTEFRTYPNKREKKLMNDLLYQGANVVVGAHPHVLHPVHVVRSRDRDGRLLTRVTGSSLGNFVSKKLRGREDSITGMILELTVSKNGRTDANVSKVRRIRTKVRRGSDGIYRVARVSR
ncbi:CapA family protein [Cohnella sp. AR92]|uniref:CapA family protein n=1 Tax=Cohnella sp. AR92 TaxID=648716 RepID=UPI000F8D1123|nr:CapA family protein [Cohnella sp. AR92]RUS45168.1 CapA family protein [Cohnella sp. AR92]